jgi:hypothetical protein
MTIRANRSQLVWSPALGWALMSCAISAAFAQVETQSPATQTIDEQTPQVDIPVAPGVSPDPGVPTAGELGISLGGFTLFPTLEVQAGYDSNVFATSSPTRGSAFMFVRPSLELRSEWKNHELRFIAAGGFGFYPAATGQNFQNYLFQVDGRLDIQTDFFLTGLVAARRETEALGTPNTSFQQAPTVVDSIPAQLSLYQKFNRFFYQLSGSATRYWYHDNGVIFPGGLPASSRNRLEFDERVRLGYELFEGVSFWVGPGLNQRVYDNQINVADQDRDSRGWYTNVGATITLGPKSILEGYIGYQELTYIADGTTTAAFTFGLTGSWNGYAPLVIRPQIMRSINESAYSNYENYISTTVGVDFTYDVHGPWQAVGGTSFNSAEYTPAFGVANVNPRTDYFWRSSIGVMYSLRPQVMIGPLYEHTNGWTTDVAAGGPSYSRDMISIRLVAKR